MSDHGEIEKLTNEMFNVPLELVGVQKPLEFEEEGKVEELTREQCKNFIDSICGIGNLLVKKGAVKYKLPEVKVEGSEFERKLLNVVNGGKIYSRKRKQPEENVATVPEVPAQVDKCCSATVEPEANPNLSKSHSLDEQPKDSSGVLEADQEEIVQIPSGAQDPHCAGTEPEAESSHVPRRDNPEFKPTARTSARLASKLANACQKAPKPPRVKKVRDIPEARAVADLPALFVTLKEIRNLGYGVLYHKHHNEQESVRIVPELKGITIGELERFFGRVFGECEEGNVESEREFVERYHRILRSLPVDPAGVKKGTNPRACGLLIPYVHCFANVPINNDEEISGLRMSSIEGGLLRLKTIKKKTGSVEGAHQGINQAMMFYGVSGSTFPEHLECGNAYGSINWLMRGQLKFWKIVIAKYCADVRRNLMDVMKKLVKDGLSDDLKKESHLICLLQHKEIILMPEFYDNCKPNPIPYKIFMQRLGELMVVGTGVHHGGGSAAPRHGTMSKAVNVNTPDYHLSLLLDFVQCNGHGSGTALVLTTEQIEELRQESIMLFNLGVERERERAVEEAVEEYKQSLSNVSSEANADKETTPGSNVEKSLTASASSQTDEEPTPSSPSSGTDPPSSTSTSCNVDKQNSSCTKAPRKEVKWHRGQVRTKGKLSPFIKCPKCNREFNQIRDRDYHVEHDSCNTNTTCDKCGQTFKFKKSLINHEEKCKKE